MSTLVRSLAFVLAGALLSACGSDVPETVPSGRVHQHVDYRQYPVQPRLDVIVVVNAARTASGVALREGVARALHDRARELADGDAPWLRDVWNPLDVRAFVANVANGELVSPREQPALTWREENATKAGADAFGAAAEAALAATAANGARTEGIVATLHDALVTAATPPDAARIIVLVSSEDDASAPPTLDAMLRREDSIIVALPRAADGPSCTGVSAPRLEAWARANGGVVESACNDIGLKTSFVDYASRCLPQPSASAGGGDTSCRVRAIVPPGTACDSERGWRTPVAASPPLNRDLAAMSACDVVTLDGEDARHCRDGASRYDGHASGWCIPTPSRTCSAPPPRLVGRAAPPWATIEVICNLDERGGGS